jgi:hypothetical protein
MEPEGLNPRGTPLPRRRAFTAKAARCHPCGESRCPAKSLSRAGLDGRGLARASTFSVSDCTGSFFCAAKSRVPRGTGNVEKLGTFSTMIHKEFFGVPQDARLLVSG